MKTLMLVAALGAGVDRQTTATLVEAIDHALKDGAATEPVMRLPRQIVELGAVLDTRQGHPSGAPVVAVTPGGFAEGIGLRIGDQVTAINDVPLLADAARAFRLSQAAQEELHLDVFRDGARMRLSGRPAARSLPGWSLTMLPPAPIAAPDSGCGFVSSSQRISDLDSMLRIEKVNGERIEAVGAASVRLAAGVHRLTVRAAVFGTTGFADGALSQTPSSGGPGWNRVPTESQWRTTQWSDLTTLVEIRVLPNRHHRLRARRLSDGNFEIFEVSVDQRECPEG